MSADTAYSYSLKDCWSNRGYCGGYYRTVILARNSLPYLSINTEADMPPPAQRVNPFSLSAWYPTVMRQSCNQKPSFPDSKSCVLSPNSATHDSKRLLYYSVAFTGLLQEAPSTFLCWLLQCTSGLLPGLAPSLCGLWWHAHLALTVITMDYRLPSCTHLVISPRLYSLLVYEKSHT